MPSHRTPTIQNLHHPLLGFHILFRLGKITLRPSQNALPSSLSFCFNKYQIVVDDSPAFLLHVITYFCCFLTKSLKIFTAVGNFTELESVEPTASIASAIILSFTF